MFDAAITCQLASQLQSSNWQTDLLTKKERDKAAAASVDIGWVDGWPTIIKFVEILESVV